MANNFDNFWIQLIDIWIHTTIICDLKHHWIYYIHIDQFVIVLLVTGSLEQIFVRADSLSAKSNWMY